jgi:hypothetical protein
MAGLPLLCGKIVRVAGQSVRLGHKIFSLTKLIKHRNKKSVDFDRNFSRRQESRFSSEGFVGTATDWFPCLVIVVIVHLQQTQKKCGNQSSQDFLTDFLTLDHQKKKF